MSTLVLIFATALVFAMGVTPLARHLALRVGFLDHPDARKIHASPMPRLGGLAMYGAFMLALILFADRFYVPQMIGIVVGATWVSFLGLWDDRVGLHAGLKLIGQIGGALILVVTGVTVELVPYPLVNTAITVFWVVGITNAMNLLDNMDGLSGGIAAIASAFFLLIAALNGQYLVGSAQRGVARRGNRLFDLQFQSGADFYGRHRQSVYRLSACRRRDQTALSQSPCDRDLVHSDSRARLADFRYDARVSFRACGAG